MENQSSSNEVPPVDMFESPEDHQKAVAEMARARQQERAHQQQGPRLRERPVPGSRFEADKEHFGLLDDAKFIYATPITQQTIKALHHQVLVSTAPESAGVYRCVDLCVGDKEIDVPWEHVEQEMRDFVDWLNEAEEKAASGHGVAAFAAEAHFRLAKIHAFEDGNGRTCRLLVNFLLARQGLGRVELPESFRDDYYAIFDSGNFDMLTQKIIFLL